MEAWREELYHHGIKGMHWGVRRYQRSDGSLTPAGQKRYDKIQAKKIAKANKSVEKFNDQIHDNYSFSIGRLISNEEEAARTNIKYASALGQEFAKLTKRASKNPAFAYKEQARFEKKSKKILNRMNDNFEKLKEEEELIRVGHQKVEEVLRNYSDANASAIMDKSYKKTQEYKDAKKAYRNYGLRAMTAMNDEPREIAAAKSYARSYERENKKNR